MSQLAPARIAPKAPFRGWLYYPHPYVRHPLGAAGPLSCNPPNPLRRKGSHLAALIESQPVPLPRSAGAQQAVGQRHGIPQAAGPQRPNGPRQQHAVVTLGCSINRGHSEWP